MQQATTITVISNGASSDVWYLNPRFELESPTVSYMQVTCPLNAGNQLWTATLGTVALKNRTTGTLLSASITPVGGTVAVNQLIVNTSHPSRAWVTRSVSGSVWDISEPLTGCATASACSPAEVDTWALGDSITAYAPYVIYAEEVLPTSAEGALAVGLSPSVLINGCQIANAGSTSFGPFVANQYATISDSLITAATSDNQLGNGGPTAASYVNVDFEGRYRGAGATISGGFIGQGGGGFSVISGAIMNKDFEIFNTTFWSGFSTLTPEGTPYANGVYIASGAVLDVQGGYLSVGSASVWGPGGLTVDGGAFLFFATSAATSLLLTGSLQLAGSSTACSTTGGATPTIACGKSLTTTLLDTAVGSGGFGDYAFQLGGGTMTNLAQ